MRENNCKECAPDQPCKKHWQRKRGESESDYDNRKVLYELTGIRDERKSFFNAGLMAERILFKSRISDLEKENEELKECLTEIVQDNKNYIISNFKKAEQLLKSLDK